MTGAIRWTVKYWKRVCDHRCRGGPLVPPRHLWGLGLLHPPAQVGECTQVSFNCMTLWIMLICLVPCDTGEVGRFGWNWVAGAVETVWHQKSGQSCRKPPWQEEFTAPCSESLRCVQTCRTTSVWSQARAGEAGGLLSHTCCLSPEYCVSIFPPVPLLRCDTYEVLC